MKMLIVTSDFPFEGIRHGGGNLSINWIKHLSKNHELSLATFIREQDRPFLSGSKKYFSRIETVPALRGWPSRLRRLPLLFRQPYPVVASRSRRMINLVRELSSSGEFDLIQFEYFHMGQYLPFVPAQIPRVLIYHDVVSPVLRQQIRITPGWRKAILYREWELTRYWEKWYAIWAQNTVALSLKDRRVIDSWDVRVNSFVLPPLLPENLFRLTPQPTHKEEILFVGAMHRPVNQDAALQLRNQIMPRVRKHFLNATCRVVGAGTPSWLKRLERPGFIVQGEVEKVEPLIQKARVVAVPLRAAGGIIVKILQAMAIGAPVVATRCANSGIGARDNRDILLADRPEVFAEKICWLLDSPEKSAKIGQAGKIFIQRHFACDQVKCRIDDMYKNIVEKQL